jgi:hypothetical protein
MFGNKGNSKKEQPVSFGFVPKPVNKNQEKEEAPKINTISRMFKNAPPPKPKVKRPIEEV